MTDHKTDHQGIVLRQLEQAIDWRRENLDPLQEAATARYLGKPFGGEQEGRSQIVMSEVRDTTRSLLTALMRLFFGPDEVLEFEPGGPEDVEAAQQRTDYIRHILERDNNGYQILMAAFKDALVRKLGVVKWWWDDRAEIKGSQHTGLTPDDVDFLTSQDGVEVVRVFESPDGLFDIEIRREEKDGRAVIDVMPPEEFIFSPAARSRDDAGLIGHVRDVPANELIEMGVPEEMVDRAKGETDRQQDGLVEAARRIDDNVSDQEDEGPEETRPVRFADLYVKIDLDGKGVALRHIQAVGPKAEWVDENPPIVDGVPFAIFEMDPEPHTMVGGSVDDDVGDLQRINSFIVRGMLDSLAQHIDPVTEVVDGQVNIKDLLNPERSKFIRVKRSGQMREVVTPFVGGSALPVLQYMGEIKENRTGQSKAAAGLDANALQSSTRTAIAATVSGAAQRQEMIARNFAEGGMRQLFTGLLRLVTQHQDQERVVRLRGKHVTVDPAQWNADMDARINVALGSGRMDDRLQTLQSTAAKIEEHIANGSPLGSLSKLRDTYAEIMSLGGFKNAVAFWPEFTPEQEQEHREAQAKNRPPSENEIFQQIEMAKIQARGQEKAAELQVKLAELQLKEAELEHEVGHDVLNAQLDAARLQIEQLKVMGSTNVGGE